MTTTEASEDESRKNAAISRLGQYMLQGWVLTDSMCRVPNCQIPLVRSKDSTQWHCVLCHDATNPWPPPPPTSSTSAPSSSLAAPAAADDREMDVEHDTNGATDFDISDEFRPTATDASYALRRDDASRLLGQHLLRGWTMLADSCPSDDCYGVPLMRNRAGAVACVVCGWADEDRADNSGPAPANAETAMVPGEGAVERDGARVEREEGGARKHGIGEGETEEEWEREIDGLAVEEPRLGGVSASKRAKTCATPELQFEAGAAAAATSTQQQVQQQATRTLDTLVAHIDRLTQMLDDNVGGVEQTALLFEALTKGAGAVRAWRSVVDG